MSEHLKKKKFYIFETLHYDRYNNKLTLIDKWKIAIRNRLVVHYLSPTKKKLKSMMADTMNEFLY